MIKLGHVLVLACVLTGLCVMPSLAQADAAADYRAAVLADNPVSYWRLNDAAGSTAADEENRNPGQVSGATLDEPGPMAGDASMRFAGSGIVELGPDESLRPPESWTLELWFKASANEAAQCAGNFGPVCDLYRYHAFGFVLQLQTDGELSAGVDTDNQTSVSATSPGSYADDQWHYVVVVRSQGNLSLFVDGAEAADTPTASAMTYYCCEDVAAIANDGACHCESFTGWLSEVAFYNDALSATRIEAHYASADISGTGGGSGGAPSCAAASTAPTLSNFAAQLCGIVGDETTIVQGQGALLDVGGDFPHVSQTAVNTWTGAPIAVVPGSDASSASASIAHINLAQEDVVQKVSDIIAEKLVGQLPCLGQIANAAKKVQEEDEAAVNEDRQAAQAITGALGGISATTLEDIISHIHKGAEALAGKLQALEDAIKKFMTGCEQDDEALARSQVQLAFDEDVTAVTGDIGTLSSDETEIALVPQGVYDVFPGLPTDAFSSGTGAVVVGNESNLTGGVFGQSAIPFGLSSTAIVTFQTVPSEIVSSEIVNVGGAVDVSGSGFGSSTYLETGLSGVLSTGAGSLPSLSPGGSSFAAHLAAAAPEPTAGSAPARLTIVKANPKGSFTSRVAIPANVAPGKHELYVIGLAPSGSPRLLETSVTVTTPPIVTNLTQSHRRWREGDKLARASRKRRPPVGTVFSFTLNESAKVSLAFMQPARGHRAKGSCVTRAAKRHRKPSCKRDVTRGTLLFTGHAGVNKLSFEGRISRRQKLKPGNYTLVLSAAGTDGRSVPKMLDFTIVK